MALVYQMYAKQRPNGVPVVWRAFGAPDFTKQFVPGGVAVAALLEDVKVQGTYEIETGYTPGRSWNVDVAGATDLSQFLPTGMPPFAGVIVIARNDGTAMANLVTAADIEPGGITDTVFRFVPRDAPGDVALAYEYGPFAVQDLPQLYLEPGANVTGALLVYVTQYGWTP